MASGHICLQIWDEFTHHFRGGWFILNSFYANIVHPDHTPKKMASDLIPHCLLASVYDILGINWLT